MSFLEIIILSFIEGITEYLPVSSTGHLIVATHFMGLTSEFMTQFNVIIQFGAILAVLLIYWKKFLPINKSFYLKLFVGFLPSAVVGLAIKDKIDALLSNVNIVAWALLLGGIVLIYVDKKNIKKSVHEQDLLMYERSLDSKSQIKLMSLRQALCIGLFQCFAFIPGVSRSAATIVGGLIVGLEKRHATEFSFFLALPTLAGATLLKAIKVYPTIEREQIFSLLLGLILSFAFALLAIRGFVALVSREQGVFRWFGIYRILLGLFILILG